MVNNANSGSNQRNNSSNTTTTRSTAGISQEVLHLVKAQRRVRGTVAVVEQGNCVIESTYGRFPFDPRSVKANKNHPDRKPQEGDPCEFRLSHHIPPTAVSIRVAVPKVKRSAPVLEDIPLDGKYEKIIAEYLEVHCAAVAPVMQKLEGTDLKTPVTLLFLIAKAQDEVEGAKDVLSDVKIGGLKNFATTILTSGVVPVELSTLSFFKQFRVVVAGLRGLAEPYKTIITNFAASRGEKMAAFIDAEISTLVDFTEYNEVVGGMVYEGLAEIVSAHVGRGVPGKTAGEMGLFIAKTNAIKGFLDHSDTVRGSNWPKDVWGHHFDTLGHVVSPSSRSYALDRLNLIITDAFSHAAHGMEFLSHIADVGPVFCFFATPCVMALAQLERLWGNAKVFTESVGVPQQQAATILSMEHPREAVAWLGNVISDMHESFRTENYDPVSYKMLNQIQGVKTSLRRVDAAVAAYAKVQVGGERSLTRALLAEQGAALGGKLLYNMIDSLGSVFQSESHSPYGTFVESSTDQPDTSSEIDSVTIAPSTTVSQNNSSAMGFLTGIARGWLGLDSSSENFASFYDGCHHLGDDASSHSSATTPSVGSGEELCRKRSLSLKAKHRAGPVGAVRSKTP